MALIHSEEIQFKEIFLNEFAHLYVHQPNQFNYFILFYCGGSLLRPLSFGIE